jgi:hypothetical protein
MNLDIKKHPRSIHDKEAKTSGVGANALWAGPYDSTGLPKGKGSSSGKNGIILNNAKPYCKPGPITQRAKASF